MKQMTAALLLVVVVACGGTVTDQPATTTAPAPDTTVTTTPPTTTTTPAFSRSQENAIRSAENYLSFMAFSRQGLIDQLLFEGFTQEQAEHGVDQAGL